MNYKNFTIIALITVLCHLLVNQYNQINTLKQEINILDKSDNLEKDQIRDLLFQISQNNLEKEAIGVKNYVAGVVDAIDRPDYYKQIWHSGYDRGVSNQKYSELLEAKTYVDYKEAK